MLIIEFKRVNSVNDLHPSKTSRPISVTETAIVRLITALQLWNVWPILVTKDGMVTLRTDMQLQNAQQRDFSCTIRNLQDDSARNREIAWRVSDIAACSSRKGHRNSGASCVGPKKRGG